MRRLKYLAMLAGSLVMVAGGLAWADRRPAPVPVVTETQGARTLKVMTLNSAHGRGTSVHQALLPDGHHRKNVERIAQLLEREAPGIVALQEADGESAWSGNFDHVRYLKERVEYRDHVHGHLVARPGLRHGVALISAMPLQDSAHVRFGRALATTPKGFVISTIEWPGTHGLEVDVVSVHLEAFRPGVRRRQVQQMTDFLRQRDNPLIVMGDMNTGWKRGRGALQELVSALDLAAYEPDNREHVSLPMLGRRLDWILASDDFEFVRYETLPEAVSDHRAVVAELALREDG